MLSHSQRTAAPDFLLRTSVAACLRTSSERSWEPLAYVSKASCSYARGASTRTPTRTTQWRRTL
jgi:hypothetical protein